MNAGMKTFAVVSFAALAVAGCGTSAISARRMPRSATTTVSTTAPPRSITTTTEPGDCNCGLLQLFSPQSSTTWWAIVESNLTPKTFVVRTTDSGRAWRDVLTVSGGTNGYFFNGDVAWLEMAGQLYRTLDGGAYWGRMGPVPVDYCQYDFVDTLHGWCSAVAPAMGSSGVKLYRTSDGGRTWALVSETGFAGLGPTTPDALPSTCDKTIIFTSMTVGWAGSGCYGGNPYLYESDDEGYEWFKLPSPPVIPGAPIDQGGDLQAPTVSGAAMAVRFDVGGDTAIATSADGGETWRTQLVGDFPQQWSVDLVSPVDWILTDGKVLRTTDDAGLSWRTWTSSVTMKDPLGTPLTLDFISPLVGWAVPGPNGGKLWWTTDGGQSWKPVVISAGPYKVG